MPPGMRSFRIISERKVHRAGEKGETMPLYLIERNFAEQVTMTDDVVAGAKPVIAEEGNQWLRSFLSADKKKTYCLYEAPNAEAIREAARRLKIPADAIIELTGEVRRDGSLVPITI